MKKLKLVACLFVMAAAFSVSSCSSDNDSPAVGEGTSEGDYWPMAVNNQWTYKIDGEEQEPMKIASTQSISGKTYFKYDNLFGTSTMGSAFEGEALTRKTGGNYYIRTSVTIPATGQTPGITVSPLEMVIFKDNLDAGQTWTETLKQTTTVTGTPPIVTTIVTVGKILEKNGSITVGGVTYTNVIKSELQQTTVGIVSTSTYWFAKDVGIVKAQTVVPAQGVDITNELSSYTVN